MNPQRAAVVAEAERWIGTPYHHHAAVRGVGVDCAQLPLAVYAAVGAIPRTDVGYYPAQWMLHRSAELYLDWVAQLVWREIGEDEIRPGDFAVWRFGRTFSHGAIVTDWPMIIHASAPDQCACRADASRDADLPGRPVKYFTLWDD